MGVLVICKFPKDLKIETKWAMPGIRSNMGFFSTQGQVTLKFDSLI